MAYEAGPRLKRLRERRGYTLESLAEAAGLPAEVVKAIELGGPARMETLHRLAQTLGAETVWFLEPPSEAPEPADARARQRDRALREMRAVLLSPVFPGRSWDLNGDEPLNAAALVNAATALSKAYHQGEYDTIAKLGPGLLRSAELHGREMNTRDVHRARADAFGTAGRWLCQVQAHDLALVALHAGLEAARKADDLALAAQIMSGQAWIMIRQARFAEVETFCAQVAEDIEPRISKASPGELAAWGMMLLRASSAAARNNRLEEARGYLALARSAGSALGVELSGHESFGPVGVAIQATENELVAGFPDRALAVANQISDEDLAQVNTAKGHRHLLDRAQGLIRTGRPDDGAQIVHSLMRKDPQWLRYQAHARRVVSELPAPNELSDFLSLRSAAS